MNITTQQYRFQINKTSVSCTLTLKKGSTLALPGALGVEAEPMTGFNRQKGKYRNKTKEEKGEPVG